MAALSWCYEFLTKKLSMFALAAETMDSDFGDFICILIEVNCALDGYEDDPTLSNNTKIERLRDLSTRLQSLDWDEAYICDVSSDNKYGILLREFQTLHEAFCGLQPQYRAIVSSAAQELAERSISFLGREINTLHDWNEHCYINAGGYVVSIARALISAELEDESNNAGAAVVFGLFCGKVDSIVDFSEDVAAGKVDLPLEILDKYCSDPKQLLTIEKQPDALRCVSECIINALTHLPDIVKYMSRVTNKSAFKLWTVLQMPSMLALAQYCDSELAFNDEMNQFMASDDLSKLIENATDIDGFKDVHYKLLCKIRDKLDDIRRSDPSSTTPIIDDIVVRNALVACTR